MRASRLGRWFAAAMEAHAGHSGFAVLGEGTEAWLSRTALADYADHTIDLQYYLYAADRSGLELLSRVAAGRSFGWAPSRACR
jgi:putative cardiolipin synthase